MPPPVERKSPRVILAGQLRRDFVILPSGQARLDVLGGNLVYAAAGMAVWEPSPPPGLVARVGEDYPQEWLEELARRGFDTHGIHILPQALDVRSFYAYVDWNTRADDDPVPHFSRVGLPFPRALLGYRSKAAVLDSRSVLSPTSLRQVDFLSEYLEASAAHICSLDYLSHSLLPAVLRQAGFTTLTLEPAAGYMNSTFWNDIPALVTGLTAFLPSEEDVRSLFKGRSTDLWEMAEALAAYGCEIVVIKYGDRGQLLYDAARGSRMQIPPYPANLVDPTGAGDAFCGGFLVGYRRTFDPLEAVLHGNISASLTIEGHGPFYSMDALPGLPQARLDSLRQAVRKL